MATSRLLSVHNQSYADDEVDLDNVLGPLWHNFGVFSGSLWNHFGIILGLLRDPICLGPNLFNPVSISFKWHILTSSPLSEGHQKNP